MYASLAIKDRIDTPESRDALQLVLTAIDEREPGDEILDPSPKPAPRLEPKGT